MIILKMQAALRFGSNILFARRVAPSLALPIAALALLLAPAATAQSTDPAASPRHVISLNGEWQIAQGTLNAPPTDFPSTVKVPGLVDMATPAFDDVGVSSTQREAFWYRKKFTVDSPIPAYAMLKIHKAMFGNKAILNGHAFDETWMSFTPTYRNLHNVLVQGENELLIRVAAHARQVPAGYAHGLDPEKTKYIPGLFDSVEIILTQTPTITNIQVVPEVENKTARIQALLQNHTGATTSAKVQFTIRETDSGRLVGTAHANVELPADFAETTATATVTIADCQLWSPENPFLYTVTADCTTDRLSDRFGMRTFRLDQATGQAMLNGKPIFLRGSNITLYRFFEDPARGALPWDADWVRRLHKLVPTMNWNSLRYCIGFPPEAWYDIADEEGILIQDEFPIWNSRHGNIPNANTPHILSQEYAAWMRERWNHPCVVMWDAQNETLPEVTGKAIQAVRAIDLSNRPWDNGYGRYRAPGDSYESHPYLFNKQINGRPFMLEDLVHISGTPAGNRGGQNTNDNPIIINEYGWVWIDRQGKPTTLSEKVYERILKGKPATPAQYRTLNARLLAALTEFWRSHRACAGVMHFCMLGYSRPGGQTSDHFTDVAQLTLEPEFVRYVKDSFAPVGLSINFFQETVLPDSEINMGVMIINDEAAEWTGTVRLTLLRDGKTVNERKQTCTVPAYGRNELLFIQKYPAEPGKYQLRATLLKEGATEVNSYRDVEVGTPQEKK